MKINRMEKDIFQSKVNDIEISQLPEGLREMMARLLNKLTGVILIGYPTFLEADECQSISNLCLYYPDDYQWSDCLEPPTLRVEFLTTLKLLKWYLDKHWVSFPASSAMICCLDCAKLVSSEHQGPCPSPGCHSHGKWRLIYGPSYQKPIRPIKGVRVTGIRFGPPPRPRKK